MSPPSRHECLLEAARATKGFMPDEEGLTPTCVTVPLPSTPLGRAFTSIVEVGAYCGRSTLYLADGTLSPRG